MATYQLLLTIDPQSLNRILAAGQGIVLARNVNGAANVVWATFAPFASNTVEWNDDYSIYASTTSIQQGAQIMAMSETGFPAQSGASYTFTSSMVFSGPNRGGASPGSYGIQNAAPADPFPTLTFGLVQTAVINQNPLSQAPLSATALFTNSQASLTPSPDVLVWLQANIQSGTIFNQIPGNATTARFGNGVSHVSLRYDSNRGVFVPG